MNIVILAAGQGKRMRSALPKVLHPVAGQSMLSHVIGTARAVAVAQSRAARIVVVVGHAADAVQAAFSDHADVQFVLQEPQLGTGHAVQQAAPLLDDAAPTLVLYGDVPLVRAGTLAALLAATTGGPHAGVAVLTVTLADPTGYGRIVRDWHGNVLKIVEQKDATEDERALREVNTGILAVPTKELKGWLARLSNRNVQQEYYLTDVIAMAVADGYSVAGVPCLDADETLGVNSKAQLAQVERIAQRRAALALMDAGATLADPARIDVRGRVTVDGEVSIDVGCVFEGEVVLGAGVTLGPYCVLRNVQVAAGAQIAAFSHLDGAVVGRGARVGPYARLRPGAQLDDDVHVGNFVEVKASRLEAGAKANHLTYIGDARVGPRTNVGAGTITANYDGVNKHRTDIGADVSIGSNVVIVAPATVGDGATVGAGSVVAGQVPAGKLTVARAKAVTFDSWQRPRRKPVDG
jgi:bifunctional UDP-N-acetylglucosamine pyrophosphorylase/glucosamine-1-phosphate N-acetyltransferase